MRRDIEFNADGVTLRGWLYTPDKVTGKVPTIVMAHGFSGVKEMTLDKYAEVFCDGGMAVLVYDNRCLGHSDGQPRHDIDPVAQRRDYRCAITFVPATTRVRSGTHWHLGHQLHRRCGAVRRGARSTAKGGRESGAVCVRHEERAAVLPAV